MATDKTKPSNIIRVKLIKQKKYGLGFLVRPRSKPPHVVVSDLVAGGMAAESGLVQIGDIILKVNEDSFEDMPYEKSVELLKALPVNNAVVLILKGPEGYISHLETRFSEEGMPKTIRVTKPILHSESIIDKIKKTLTGSSSPKSCRTKQTQAACDYQGSKTGAKSGDKGDKKATAVNGDIVQIPEQYLNGTACGVEESESTVKVTSDNRNGVADSDKSLSNNPTAAGLSTYKNQDIGQVGASSIPGNSAGAINGPFHGLGINAGPGSQEPPERDGLSPESEDDISIFTDDAVKKRNQSKNGNVAVQLSVGNTATGAKQSNNQTGYKMVQKNCDGNNIKAVLVNGLNTDMHQIENGDSGEGGSAKFNGVKKGLDVDSRAPTPSSRMSPIRKFVKLRNVGNERPLCTDTLHTKSSEPLTCTPDHCTGSLMDAGLVGGSPRSRDELLRHARDFINEYYQSIKRHNSPAHLNRWAEVESAIERSGTYELTYAELTYGAKTAWRNAPRCIGRIQWSKLQVFDARHISTARGMFEAICNHIKYGTNKGNIRSAITLFPPRTDGEHDFRVWNQQFIRYAGYKQDNGTVVGDPANVELTEICQKLGWKGKGTRFDVLPLVLQANGHDPEVFEIPPELVLEVQIKHPKFPWFAEMGLRWYALPAVANMVFDCGGQLFTAAPFNGWYMGTEIGARDFCDKYRYNLLEDIAKRMGFDTRKNSTLWKDRTLVEINVAVLHSFQSQGVTITDHHAASESFMKHLDNEQKLRGGCPADWVWVVPPMSGSILPVFHQEMLVYKLKPSFEYQADPWKTHVWKKDKERTKSTSERPRRKIGFRELARAVKFSAKLMGKALARRVKCVILYGTETGKSEGFAQTLCQTFRHAFDAKVVCMDEYDVSELEHEALVLIVTSTFGNGDPPENGEGFAKSLFEMKHPESRDKLSKQTSYMRMSSIPSADRDEDDDQSEGDNSDQSSAIEDNLTLETGPLSNVRYSVFALGSSAYPNFCAFGHYLDNMFHDLGAERIYKIIEGDELCGQEESFRTWARDVFKSACDTFCVGDDNVLLDAAGTLNKTDHSWTPDTYRITPANNERQQDVIAALSQIHSRDVIPAKFMERTQLQSRESDRQTLLIKLDATFGSSQLLYQPGDHVAIFPENSQKIVDALLIRLHNAPPPDQLIKVEFMNERSTPLGSMKAWDSYARLPSCTLRTAFSRFLDITTPPSQTLLKLLASQASKDCDKESLENLANDSHLYEEWKHETYPNIVQVLDQFPSLRVPPSLLLTQLPLLQSRFYSISSSLKFCPGEIHATVAVVRYCTQGENGSLHEGVCSNWLNRIEEGTAVPCLVRHAPAFHMPDDVTLPMILVGPGTGIAPFRSFWHQRKIDMEMLPEPQHGSRKGWGNIYLYFGCRNSKMDDIYKHELQQMKNEGVLKEVYTALSREPNQTKTYVQTILKKNAVDVFNCIVKNGGHFYVCGDVKMASDVTATLEKIISQEGNMTAQDAKNFVLKLRDNNRFHEDIFGVTLRSSEVTDRARDQAKRAWNFINSASKAKPVQDKETVAPIPSGESKAPKGRPKAPLKPLYIDSMKAE